MAQRRDTRQRFEQWVKNPTCDANVLSAVHGIEMAKVAQAENIKVTTGQSPFAIARGVTFERALFRDSAEQLREALEHAGVLASGSKGFLDLRIRLSGGPLKDLDEALGNTVDLLRSLERGTSNPPSIIAAATLRVPGGVMLPDAILVLDVLTVHPAARSEPTLLRVGEIKVYPDRGGHTSAEELATARAQGGVYLHALELVVRELGLVRVRCADQGFLVLTKPGSSRPSVRAEEEFGTCQRL